ncbi:hypothetical protein MMC30_004082 [Trapelia coarctata]|nr:hypothetical protein [Trapelia coarctata]
MTPYGASQTPTSIQESFTFGHSTHDENSTRTADRRTLYGEESPPSPIGILQEISNTTYRKRKFSRPAITTLFQDADASRDVEELDARSRHQENTNVFAPSPRTGAPLRNMKLREGSLNEKTAPVASTLVGKQGKAKRVQKPKPRVSSNEIAMQIEALEKDNDSLTKRVNDLTSPKRTKAHAANLRMLQAKIKEQAETIEEWERNFQERVGDARYESQIEQRLQTRIRALEDDCELKDAKIEQLEWELETVRAEVREAESLKATNQGLERRLVVLTELLAQSPTRPDFPSITSTPGSGDPTKRTPRPRSLLLPRMHSSPTSARHSAGFADAIAWHGRNIGSISSLSISENPEDELRSPSDNKQPPSILSEPLTRPVSMLSVSENADSSQPATFLSSRPTSMVSNCSFSASWGLPAPNGSSERSQSVGRSRKMRRFPSGQCSLKPLILPVAAAVTPSLLASAPATSNHTTPSNMLRSSRFSLDPTTAFLSSIVDEISPFNTPTQRPRRRSLSLARRQTLDALEGRSRYVQYEDDDKGKEAQGDVTDNAEHSIRNVSVTPSPCVLRTQRRSLQMELEQAEEAEKAFLARGPSATNTPSTLDPRVMKQAFRSTPQPDIADTPLQLPRPSDDGLPLRRVVSNSSDTPRPPKTILPVPASPDKPLPLPLPSAITPSTLPLFTRLTGLLSALNPDPLLLAKRILNNACHTSSNSSTGGLGWWLLGLLLGFRRKQKGADVRVVEEEAMNRVLAESEGEGKFDWRAYSAEASKARRARELWRDLRYRVVAAGAEGGEDGRGRRLDERGRFAEGRAGKGDVRLPQADPEMETAAVWQVEQYEDETIEPPFRCDECVEPPSRRSLRLWVRFSVAICVALGVAAMRGPGALLVETPGEVPLALPQSRKLDSEELRAKVGERRGGERREGIRGMRDSQETMVGSPIAAEAGEGGLQMKKRDGDGMVGESDDVGGGGGGVGEGKENKSKSLNDGCWGWEVTFAETLGPRDFEKTT